MKLKHVGIIVVSVLAMSSAAVSAAEGDESVTTTVNGGVIHFKGEVVNAACAIDSESMNQTVELGQVRSSRLAKAGDLSSAVGFNIKLNDCDTNVSSNAAVAFLGTTVTSNDDTLALQSSAAGSAQNVGIQILDRTGEVLVLDGATFSAKTDLIDGTNILPFQARYIALKSVPFGAIVTHGENKNGSIVAENGQVYLTGLPQSGKLQVSWGNDKNSNCIVDYKLPAVSPGTLLNQQTAICR
ncbi:type 1 fimbrial major subunit FimA [Escherichia coli]